MGTLSRGRIVITSSMYLFQTRGGQGGLFIISSSIFCITSSAKTTEIGEPIGVPCVCLYISAVYLCTFSTQQCTNVLLARSSVLMYFSTLYHTHLNTLVLPFHSRCAVMQSFYCILFPLFFVICD